MPSIEQGNDRTCDIGVFGQCRHNSRHAVGHTRLTQIAIPCPQPDNRLRIKTADRHQLVKDIIFKAAVQNLAQRAFDNVRTFHHRCHIAAAQRQSEIMDIIAVAQCAGQFFQHVETEILKRRDNVAERKRAATAINFEPKIIAVDEQPGDFTVVALHIEQANHVTRGFFGRISAAIIGGETGAVTHEHCGRALFIGQQRESRFDRRLPSAHHKLDFVIQRGLVDLLIAIWQIKRVPQQGNPDILQTNRPAEQATACGIYEHILDLLANACRDIVARQPDEDIQMAAKWRPQRNQLRPWAIGQRHRGQCDPFQIIQFQRNQKIVGQRRQCMRHRLARMPRRVKAKPVHKRRQMRSQHGYRLWGSR